MGHFWSNLFSSNVEVCEWKHQGQNMTVVCFPKKWAWPTTTTVKWVWEHSEQLSSQFGQERVLYKKKGMTNDLGAKEQILNLRQYSVSVWATEQLSIQLWGVSTSPLEVPKVARGWSATPASLLKIHSIIFFFQNTNLQMGTLSATTPGSSFDLKRKC